MAFYPALDALQHFSNSQMIGKFGKQIQSQLARLGDAMMTLTDPADQTGMLCINRIQGPAKAARFLS